MYNTERKEADMKNRIRILATSDVHGFIYPYRYSDQKEAPLGFARVAEKVKELKDENTILIDNGDVLEGSPLSFYHYYRHPDEICPSTKVMHAMHYDLINLGNHDFNYGPDALHLHLENAGSPCITSNVYENGESIGPAYVIRSLAGRKTAFVGVVTQYITHWESEEHLKNLTFSDALETMKKNVQMVKEKEHPDYIIGVYHGGFERDLETREPTEELTGENEAYQMIQEIPDLDVLISGHQHRSLSGTLNGTVYTQTAANGQEIACIEIDPESGKITPQVLKCDGPAVEELLEPVNAEEKECQTWLDSALGICKVNLKVTDENDARLHKTQLITFLNRVQMEVTGADLASTALFLGATGFDSEITMRNLVSTYVYPNTLVVKKISGKVLKEYLEQDARFWTINAQGEIAVSPEYDWPKPQHYNYDMLDGVEYTIQVSNEPGSRIVSLTRNGKDVKPEDTFTLCLNNYRASGGGNFDMIRDAETVKVDASSMVEVLASYILKHRVIDFTPVNNIKVIR
jgi:2',3'-cyclic-nucleotide 2'-phosphodiesterase/3'-nucleotidase